MPGKVKYTIVVSVGILCLIIGVVGLVLPVLQGIVFIIVGLVLLSLASERVRAFTKRYTATHPKLAKWFDTIEQRARRIIGPLQ